MLGIGLRQKYLFWGFAKCHKIQRSTPGFNSGIWSNFSMMGKVNRLKCTDWYVVYPMKNVYVKEKVYKWVKVWFAFTSLIQKDIASSVKNGFGCHLGDEKMHAIDFL